MPKFKIIPNINDSKRMDDYLRVFEEIKDKPVPVRKSVRDEDFHISNVVGEKRFYISNKKYYIFEGKRFQNRHGETEKFEDYLGVELIELATKKVVGLDVSLLCNTFMAHIIEHGDVKGTIRAQSESGINRYICDIVKRIKPYVTNIELANLFIDYVGKRHVYFDDKIYKIAQGSLFRDRRILNAHFVLI